MGDLSDEERQRLALACTDAVPDALYVRIRAAVEGILTDRLAVSAERIDRLEFELQDAQHDVDNEREFRTKDADAARVAEAGYRDLVSRLGFGDNITEPMAGNDWIVAFFEQQGREADEWRESQNWRNDCALAGHSDDQDCYEHDPRFAPERAARAAERALVERVEAVCDDIDAFMGYRSPTADRFRAALRPEAATTEGARTPEEQLLHDIFGRPVPHREWPCATPDCPGDGRYAPPGRGHVAGCTGTAARPSSTRGGDDGE